LHEYALNLCSYLENVRLSPARKSAEIKFEGKSEQQKRCNRLFFRSELEGKKRGDDEVNSVSTTTTTSFEGEALLENYAG
jgi:hypothetical protein